MSCKTYFWAQIGTPVTPAHQFFSTLFWVRNTCGTDRGTDGRHP